MSEAHATINANSGDPDSAEARSAGLVYILYLVSLIFGITAIIGLVMAYVHRGSAPAWVATHYTFLIRTFWYSLVIWIVGIVLTVVIIGWLVLLVWVVWFIVRCVKGRSYLARGQAHPDPSTLMFG